MILGQGIGLVGVGVALGVIGALLLSRFVRGFLFEVTPHDPLTFITFACAARRLGRQLSPGDPGNPCGSG